MSNQALMSPVFISTNVTTIVITAQHLSAMLRLNKPKLLVSCWLLGKRGMATNQIIGFMEADRTMRQSPINTAVHCLCMVLHYQASPCFYELTLPWCHLSVSSGNPSLNVFKCSPPPIVLSFPHCLPLKAGWCLHRDHHGPYGTAAATGQRKKLARFTAVTV